MTRDELEAIVRRSSASAGVELTVTQLERMVDWMQAARFPECGPTKWLEFLATVGGEADS